ncbi:hypothetical protein [Roseococcus sp. YIM B11640]|uniref:hypothetical protein n=1 Tax=Roseococcus sp. YIM B11640 TaxID=3133973 RepID=UPI003C7C8591
MRRIAFLAVLALAACAGPQNDGSGVLPVPPEDRGRQDAAPDSQCRRMATDAIPLDTAAGEALVASLQPPPSGRAVRLNQVPWARLDAQARYDRVYSLCQAGLGRNP